MTTVRMKTNPNMNDAERALPDINQQVPRIIERILSGGLSNGIPPERMIKTFIEKIEPFRREMLTVFGVDIADQAPLKERNLDWKDKYTWDELRSGYEKVMQQFNDADFAMLKEACDRLDVQMMNLEDVVLEHLRGYYDSNVSALTRENLQRIASLEEYIGDARWLDREPISLFTRYNQRKAVKR